MNVHFPKAIENGLKKEELVEQYKCHSCCSGWPTTISAALHAKEILGPFGVNPLSEAKHI